MAGTPLLLLPSLPPRRMIDLLQKWDQAKLLESMAKTKILGKDKEGISAVDPDKYASRFLSFLGGRIEE
jgi:hypothetical protein